MVLSTQLQGKLMDVAEELLNDFVKAYEQKMGVMPGVLLILIHPTDETGGTVSALSNYKSPDPRLLARKFADDMLEEGSFIGYQ
jgi:hypothetical protein